MSQSGTYPGWFSPVDYIGLAFNFIAAVLLACALFPPFLDTKRSKMTYGLSDNFFLCYTGGALCMGLNAVLNIVMNCNGSVNTNLVILFCVFLSINSLSLYINSYCLRVKRANMKAAAEKGISEQEYWETYLSPQAKAGNLGK